MKFVSSVSVFEWHRECINSLLPDFTIIALNKSWCSNFFTPRICWNMSKSCSFVKILSLLSGCMRVGRLCSSSPVPFNMQSNFAIHDVSTVSLLSPSISGSDLTRFSILLRNTSRKSCCVQAPLATIFWTRSDFRKTSWYDCTAFWKASSAMICVSPFMKAWKRFVMVSRFCLVIFGWRFVMSLGCLLLNGYEIHRDTNTYSWSRFFLSSSSSLTRSASSTGSFGCSFVFTDGEGDVGRSCWPRLPLWSWWDAGERFRLKEN